MKIIFKLTPLIMLLLVACGKENSTNANGDLSELGIITTPSAWVGLYTITHQTENKVGCTTEGGAITGEHGQTQFRISTNEGIVGYGLTVKSCSDAVNCAEDYETYYPVDFIHWFTQGNDNAGYYTEFHGGSNIPGGDSLCVGFGTTKVTLKSLGVDSVIIERQKFIAPDFAKPAEGCLDKAIAVAATVSCTELWVVRGVRQ